MNDASAELNPNHLSPETVEEYFSAGVEVMFIIAPNIPARLVLDPLHEEVRLYLPARGAQPDVTAYEHIRLDEIAFAGEDERWYVLSIDAREMHFEACSLAESIVDRITEGIPFAAATAQTLLGIKSLLGLRKRMPLEKVIGLFGELLLLSHLVHTLGEAEAMHSWLGPHAVEHDFGFGQVDAEVKTTRSAKRSHLIGSETQLMPVPGRDLYLVSIQLIEAGLAEGGRTIGQLIGAVRQQLSVATAATFDAELKKLGWFDTDADLYREAYLLRNVPAAFLVDDLFPAITVGGLDRAIPGPHRTLVSGVSYRLELTTYECSAAPQPLAGFCKGDPT